MGDSINVKTIISVLVVLIVGLALIPTVMTATTDAAASLSGASKTFVELIPLFYVIALTLSVVYWAVGSAKTK